MHLQTLVLFSLAMAAVHSAAPSGFRDMRIETSPRSGQTIVHLTATAEDLWSPQTPKPIKDLLVHLRILDGKTGRVLTDCSSGGGGGKEEGGGDDGIPILVRIQRLVIGGISAPRAVQISSNRDQGFINRGNINMPMYHTHRRPF
ncbi:hypothetical protein DFQ27_001991 [Actinomortierella ambigua]|uniref:Uncharacterized protein n=1 Tax=Actinomortierella ambigua TaxID=1343610 RepID=A0A9P6Q8I9_9FUNG|nr:hypothetical protein DFQ27_001991 [Actinomortierella ambigua]